MPDKPKISKEAISRRIAKQEGIAPVELPKNVDIKTLVQNRRKRQNASASKS